MSREKSPLFEARVKQDNDFHHIKTGMVGVITKVGDDPVLTTIRIYKGYWKHDPTKKFMLPCNLMEKV